MISNEFYLRNIWDRTVQIIIENHMIPYETTKTIQSDSKLIKLSDEEAVVLCDLFINQVVISQSIAQFEEALKEVVGHQIPIRIVLKSEYEEENNDNNELRNKGYVTTKLDPRFTFESFVVGRSNIQSQVSALAVASRPGTTYNPLFIYGNSGLGKTHLLNAIANRIIENMPDYKIGLISGLDFVEGVASSIKNGLIDEFKKEFYNLDVLLVDDIQFIAGKEKTHEVFFSIFNELVNNRKQVVLTSDRMPKDIKGLEERIISRFNQGLNVNIEAPEYETSLNILKRKLEGNQTSVDDEVLSYIATNFSQDVRQLEGALNRLLFYTITFSPVDHITIKEAYEAFKDQIPASRSNELSVDLIKKVVCDYYGVSKSQLNSKIRTKNIAIPRQIAMYLSRKLLDLSYKDIGYSFGKRDHSTVISACDKVEDRAKKDPLFATTLNDIEVHIKN